MSNITRRDFIAAAGALGAMGVTLAKAAPPDKAFPQGQDDPAWINANPAPVPQLRPQQSVLLASSLTIRLCQTDPDPARNIALNPFVESMYSALGGWHTRSNIENFYNMTAADITAFDVLVDKIISTTDLTERVYRIQRIRSILTFWEQGDVPTYQDEDSIETHLLAIDQGP